MTAACPVAFGDVVVAVVYALISFVVVWTVCGIVGSLIWQRKGGSSRSGFWIGFLWGVFGIAYLAIVTPSGQRVCPHCRERVHEEATVCPHCHRDIKPQVAVAPSLIGKLVTGSVLGMPSPWNAIRVEASNDRLWWRPAPGEVWCRAPYVDKYGNAWDGTRWTGEKRPTTERWQGPAPTEPPARGRAVASPK